MGTREVNLVSSFFKAPHEPTRLGGFELKGPPGLDILDTPHTWNETEGFQIKIHQNGPSHSVIACTSLFSDHGYQFLAAALAVVLELCVAIS